MRIRIDVAALLSLILLSLGSFAQTRTTTVPPTPEPGPPAIGGQTGRNGVGGESWPFGDWTSPQYAKVLHMFGYHPVDPGARESLIDATKTFQHDHGLPVSGEVDGDTERVLRRLYKQLAVRLEAVGFWEREDAFSRSLHIGIRDPNELPDLSDAIRRYESEVGLPTTGVFRGAVWESLRRDAAVSAALRGGSPPQLLPFGRVLLASRRSGSSSSYLVGNGDFVETWSLSHGKVDYRERGPDKFLSVDYDVHGAFLFAVPDAFVVQVPPHAASESASMSMSIVANRQEGAIEIREEVEHIKDIVSGRSGSKAIERAIASARKQGRRPRILVYRSAFAQAGTTKSQLARYQATRNVEIPDSLELAVALQRRYGATADIFLVNDVDRAIENLKALPRVEAGSQIRVYVDKKGFQDFKTVDHLRPSLKGAQIEAVRVGEVQSGAPRIALIVSHNTPDARALISELGRAGQFKGSIVALAVCGQGGEVPFNTQLILESGARGVLFYDQRIKQVAVERALYQLCELVRKEGLTNGNLQSLLRLAVDRALGDTRLTASERADLRLLRGSVLQLSTLLTALSGDAA